MNWSITGGRPVYLQLIEQMERAIVAGEYQAGARLPGVRELAAEAAVGAGSARPYQYAAHGWAHGHR